MSSAVSPRLVFARLDQVRERIRVEDLRVTYAGDRASELLAIDGLDLSVSHGEFVSIVGPSGCGKSTLLKVIIGLIPVAGGRIYVDEQSVRAVPAQLGLMFQSDTLLPWARVIDNITIALELRGVAPGGRRNRATELLGMVGLAGFEHYFPSKLSGGMRKRAQLAQILAYDPEILLMDEPFGALDAQTKILLGRQFLSIWERLRKSVVFVTHDLEEAIALSDRVVVMSRRPGSIKSEHHVDLPRPRDFYEIRMSDRFRWIQQRIWRDLAAEVVNSTWY